MPDSGVSAVNHYVLVESRIGVHEISPIYSVYGGYASLAYARKVARDIAREYGTQLVNDHFKSGRYYSGVLNTHRLTIITDSKHSGETTDSRGKRIDLYYRSVKYPWKG